MTLISGRISGRTLRRHGTLLVSGGLVLLIGGLGLVAGHTAGQQARDVHRADRLALQETLAGLVEQYTLLSAAEVVDALEASGPWSAVPGDPASTRRLEQLVTQSRALDAGAILLGQDGRAMAAWSPEGDLPAQDDPGWVPLRRTVLAADGALPLSGVLRSDGKPLLAMGLPVLLDDGSRALVAGLWDARAGGLQQYVAELSYGQTGHGYVVDAAGHVLAGPDERSVGGLLPLQSVREKLHGDAGILDAGGHVTSYAKAGRSGWTALTPQDRDEFEGALARSNRLVQVAVVALLLIAGAGLVLLHRKREAALEVAALHDDLTGLHNRRGWFLLAEHELERARRQQTSRVLLFVDLDGLKQVNDALGHREGDAAIVAAADVLRAASRTSDILGRLGGDEFVLLLGEEGKLDVARRRLAEAVDAYNARSDAAFELRLSAGAEVWFPHDGWTLDELVRRADQEMYVEKSSRPSRHEGLLRLPSQRGPAADAPSR